MNPDDNRPQERLCAESAGMCRGFPLRIPALSRRSGHTRQSVRPTLEPPRTFHAPFSGFWAVVSGLPAAALSALRLRRRGRYFFCCAAARSYAFAASESPA